VADICYEAFDVKGRVECGTIHTFQGKEAEIVFFVLGTSPENFSARDWVAGTPNMLNVAVTRAKARLYVIGNRRVWGRHRYFSELARVLPVKEHFSGRLF
jgi:superfamily I DNA and/or RNA helicase